MVEGEDGLQVSDLATQVEKVPLTDSGKKKSKGQVLSSGSVDLVLSMGRIMRCHIIGSFILMAEVLLFNASCHK